MRILLASDKFKGSLPAPAVAQALRRVRVYTFHARIAERWQDGRVFLAGDAAHLTPPFAGQGMNSGLRDAHNLAWKLAEALRMDHPDELLASYETERKPHAKELQHSLLTADEHRGLAPIHLSLFPRRKQQRHKHPAGLQSLPTPPPTASWARISSALRRAI